MRCCQSVLFPLIFRARQGERLTRRLLGPFSPWPLVLTVLLILTGVESIALSFRRGKTILLYFKHL